MALKQAVLGQAAEKTVLIESGRLAESLIKLTPSAKKSDIEQDVRSKFVSLNLDHTRQVSEGSDADWYAFSPNAIFGVVKSKDMTDASVEDLYKIHISTEVDKHGRSAVGKRGKQTVYLWQKIVTKTATVNKLIAKIKTHVGRRSAAWAKCLEELIALGYKSSYSIPAYIQKHVTGARGYSTPELNKVNPSVTITNFAVGIGNREINGIIQSALDIRATAMTKRLEYLVKYPEKISEEQ